jgi:hypothetical protein
MYALCASSFFGRAHVHIVYASFSAASSLLAQQCLVPLLVLRLQPLLSRTVELVMLPAFFVYSVS